MIEDEWRETDGMSDSRDQDIMGLLKALVPFLTVMCLRADVHGRDVAMVL